MNEKKWCLLATKKKDVKKRCTNFFYSCLIYHKWIHPSTKYINSVEASAKYYTASVKRCKTRIRPLRSHFSIPLGWHGRGEQVDLWNCRVLMQVKLQFFGFSSPESLSLSLPPTSSYCTRKEHQIYSLRTFGIPKIFFWKPFVTGQSYGPLQLIRKGLLFTVINYIYSIDYYMVLRFFFVI